MKEDLIEGRSCFKGERSSRKTKSTEQGYNSADSDEGFYSKKQAETLSEFLVRSSKDHKNAGSILSFPSRKSGGAVEGRMVRRGGVEALGWSSVTAARVAESIKRRRVEGGFD